MLSKAAKERQRLLNVRLAMIDRCHNPANPQFKDYGGRGVTVCQRWLDSPAAFIGDIGPRPAGMTLDRIDNGKGYEPGNVRWATRAEQQRNRRTNVMVDVDGVRLPLVDACALRGLSYKAVQKRISMRGWSPEEALSTPVSRSNPRPKRTHLPERIRTLEVA